MDYKIAITGIQNQLGIVPSHSDRCEIIPYVTYILGYLNRELLGMTGPGIGIKEKVAKVLEINDSGLDDIVLGRVRDLAGRVGISDSDVYIEEKEIPYRENRFVYTWGHVLTSLIDALRAAYPELFLKGTQGCSCNCSSSCTADNETWTSGVYPYDEDYDSSLGIYRNPWRTTVTEIPRCTECGRDKP